VTVVVAGAPVHEGQRAGIEVIESVGVDGDEGDAVLRTVPRSRPRATVASQAVSEESLDLGQSLVSLGQPRIHRPRMPHALPDAEPDLSTLALNRSSHARRVASPAAATRGSVPSGAVEALAHPASAAIEAWNRFTHSS
jgi:hypothetical protein